MGVYEGRGQLHKAMKNLQMRWAETRAVWQDVRGREFEQRFLMPLEQDMKQAVGAMDQMGVLLNKIRSECQ